MGDLYSEVSGLFLIPRLDLTAFTQVGVFTVNCSFYVVILCRFFIFYILFCRRLETPVGDYGHGLWKQTAESQCTFSTKTADKSFISSKDLPVRWPRVFVGPPTNS